MFKSPKVSHVPLIIPLLREEIRESNSPRRGHRAWHECKRYACSGACLGHEQSCQLNGVIEWFSERYVMPRAKKSKKDTFSPVEFIRYNLTAADKQALDTFSKKPPMPMDDLMKDCLQANHKITYSYNETNDNYIVSVTGKPEECDNASKCYTSYAKDPITALWVAMFKYHVIWDRGVWESLDDDADFG